jgi:hypothetical protein
MLLWSLLLLPLEDDVDVDADAVWVVVVQVAAAVAVVELVAVPESPAATSTWPVRTFLLDWDWPTRK